MRLRLRDVGRICILAVAMTLAPALPRAEQVAYSPGVLRAAQEQNKPIIVHVTASWCSTCAAQAPIVLGLMKEPRYKDIVLVTVDFDTQKALLRKLGVQAQSTFVAFKGKREIARSTGVTDQASIERLFDATI